MDALKIVVIGVGKRAMAQLETIRKLKDKYRLVAVCDVDEKRAEEVGAIMGVNSYTDLEIMLDKERIDVAFIAVQAEGHHPIAGFLAERKVSVITETPIAITAACARIMIEAAERNGVMLEVSENVYRWPHERLKRKIVEAGLIGIPKGFYLSYTSGSYHGMSAIRRILGCEAETAKGIFPDEDGIMERGFLLFQGGICGTYEFNKERGNYWEIKGELGEIRGNQLILYDGDRRFGIKTKIAESGGTRAIKEAYVEGMSEVFWENPFGDYPLEDADDLSRADALLSLYHAVVDGKPLDYGGENGKRDVELLMAIRGSAMRGGEPIDLPLTEMTDYERLIHREFERAYGVDPLELKVEHLRIKYTLPDTLCGLLYYGRP